MKPFVVPSCLLLVLPLMGCDGNGTGPSEDPIASITVSPPSPVLEIGNTVQLSAQALTAKGVALSTVITWSTSNEAVATCSESGMVTGIAEGTATITATSGGVDGTASVVVVDLSLPAPPSDIKATPLSNTEVDISWSDNSQNEDQFRIDREPVPGGVSGNDPGPSRAFAEIGFVGPNVTTFRDTGLASGTSYRYRVRACNENGCSDPGTDPEEVSTFPELGIETTSLTDGMVGQAYQQALTTTGGLSGLAWSVSGGSLPDGITLSGGGVLSGTPTAPGAFDFTVQVIGGGQTVSRELTLFVQGILTITSSTTLPSGVVGTPYETLLQATGGNGVYTWTVLAGSLPGGLTLDPTGLLSGTPTSLEALAFTVQVTSSGQSVVSDFSIRTYNPLEITSGAPLPGREGLAYSHQLTASGGSGVFGWSVSAGALPDGITLDPVTGVIAGTPTLVGTFDFTVEVTSAGLITTEDYSLTITPALAVTTTSLPTGRVGIIYTQFLHAAGGNGTFVWSLTAGSLPPGLTLHSGNGAITGTPNTAGVFPFTVQVASNGLTASANLSLGVYVFLTVTTTSVPVGTFGQPYSATLSASGGDGTYTWTLSAGTLPQGLSLGADGVISGTPTWRGPFNFTVRVQSGDGQATFKSLTITIN